MSKKIKVAGALHKHHPVASEVYRLLTVIVGGVLQGIGLELFLLPNGFLDGGVIGLAILAITFVGVPLGLFIALFNLPFIVLTWIKLGRRVAIRTTVGILALVASTLYFHHFDAVTDNFSLALGYGGLLLGLGTGFALRAGGALDGTEALASILSHKSRWSVDQLILGVNICIFGVAAFVLTPEAAMASALLFYVVVAPIIKRVVDGGSELKLAEIVTSFPQEVVDAIHTQNNRRIVSNKSKAFTSDGVLGEVYTLKVLMSRMEEMVLGDLVLEADPEAIIVFEDVSNVRGGIYEVTDGH